MEKKFIRYDEQYTRLKLLYKNTFKKKQTSLKILILHGFGSTAESCKEQITPLFDSLNETCELHFVNGMHDVPQLLALMFGSSAGNAWWSMNPSMQGEGYEESLKQLIHILEKEPKKNNIKHFDGIIGFSQGAAMVGMLIAEQAIRKKTWFKFACCISGFIPNNERMAKKINDLSSSKANNNVCPSFHVFGLGDVIIQHEKSNNLAKQFEGSFICKPHEGGHEINVTNPTVLHAFQFFIRKVSKLCTST